MGAFCICQTYNASLTSTNYGIVQIGNGGIFTGIDVAQSDGTLVGRMDSSGCYLWNTTRNKWVRILNTSSMPAGSITLDNAQGCDEIVIDPSNTSTFWMLFQGKLYRSANQGTNWFQVTGFPNYPPVQSPECCSTKGYGKWIRIDPNNSAVVYVATPSQGVYVTTNGTAAVGSVTFSQVTSVGAGLPLNINAVGNAPPNAGTISSQSLNLGTINGTLVSMTAATDNSQCATSTSWGFTGGDVNYVQIWETSNFANSFFGTVHSNSGTNLQVNVTNVQGSGSHSDWTVSCQNTLYSGSNGGGAEIEFDTSGGTTGGKTNDIFIVSYQLGTFLSTNAGSTWALTNGGTGTMSRTSIRMRADNLGHLYMGDDDSGAFGHSGYNADKFSIATGNWTSMQTASAGGLGGVGGIAIDYNNCSADSTCHVTLIESGGPSINYSVNGGASFNTSGGNGGRNTYSCTGDVLWLCNQLDFLNGYFSAGDGVYIPSGSNEICFSSEGMWCTVPASSGQDITLTEQTRGVEEFLTNQVISPVGASGSILVSSWDFACFYTANFTTYPSHVSCAGGDSPSNLVRGYMLDWIGSTSDVVAIVNNGTGATSISPDYSGISTAGGVPPATTPWTLFSSLGTIPVSAPGGCMAAGTANNIVWMSIDVGGNVPYLTTNGGTTWAEVSIPGGTPTQGWGSFTGGAGSDITYAKFCDSDKSNGDLYLYNTDTGSGDAVYRYTSGAWSFQSNPNFGDAAYINGQMKVVYNQAGYLFFTDGEGGSAHPDTSSKFSYSTNDGVTWTVIPNFAEVTAFGFGVAFAGHSFPAIYAAGWYNGTYGLWRSVDWDGAKTWQNVGTYPNTWAAAIHDIDGDKNIVGQFYGATETGVFCGTLAASCGLLP